jgi:hypothetical protein
MHCTAGAKLVQPLKMRLARALYTPLLIPQPAYWASHDPLRRLTPLPVSSSRVRLASCLWRTKPHVGGPPEPTSCPDGLGVQLTESRLRRALVDAFPGARSDDSGQDVMDLGEPIPQPTRRVGQAISSSGSAVDSNALSSLSFRFTTHCAGRLQFGQAFASRSFIGQENVNCWPSEQDQLGGCQTRRSAKSWGRGRLTQPDLATRLNLVRLRCAVPVATTKGAAPMSRSQNQEVNHES